MLARQEVMGVDDSTFLYVCERKFILPVYCSIQAEFAFIDKYHERLILIHALTVVVSAGSIVLRLEVNLPIERVTSVYDKRVLVCIHEDHIHRNLNEYVVIYI